MARTITPIDACAIMTEMVAQATGNKNIAKIDASNFVSAGETVWSTGKENTMNALAIVMGRRFMAVRPRTARMNLIQSINNDLYTSRISKVSFYAKDPENAGNFNTDVYDFNLGMGSNGESDNPDPVTGNARSTPGMWVQNPSIPLEMSFAGTSCVDLSFSQYYNQMKQAMRSPEEFASFLNAEFVEWRNSISRVKEQFNRLYVLNKIAGIYDMTANMPGSVVNLTALYNAKYSTSYTSEQLRTTYFDSFIKFFVETFKLTSELMTYDTEKYHLTPTKLKPDGVTPYSLLRHTPYSKQRVFLYEPLFVSARANVMPDIFNPSYLNMETQYEGVMYWQDFNNPSQIDIEPAIFDKSTGAQIKGNRVQIPYVVGMIFDEDGLMTSYQYDGMFSTPLHPKKLYTNHFMHISRNGINDPTENAVIFIMMDPPTNNSVGSTRSKK